MTGKDYENDADLTEISLRCKDKRFHNARWTMKLLEDGAQLFDDSNQQEQQWLGDKSSEQD
jgi:hypothetical protein